MSSKKWSTVLERKHIHMKCDAICLVEDDVVRTMSMNSSDDDETFLYSYNGSEQEHNNDGDLSLLSCSSSSSSSSSSSWSTSWSSISTDSMSDKRIEDLLMMMQQQHQRILVNVHDPNIEWGHQLRLNNISNSECIDNCHMRCDNLQHMFAALEDEASFGRSFQIHLLRLPIHSVLQDWFLSATLQIFQTKTIISRYGAHLRNEEVQAFSHHPDILFGIIPCVYALLIRSVHMAPTNAILFPTDQEQDRQCHRYFVGIH